MAESWLEGIIGMSDLPVVMTSLLGETAVVPWST